MANVKCTSTRVHFVGLGSFSQVSNNCHQVIFGVVSQHIGKNQSRLESADVLHLLIVKGRESPALIIYAYLDSYL